MTAIVHFPSVILIVGYLVFWLELYFIDASSGSTSFLAIILSALLFFVGLVASKQDFVEMIKKLRPFSLFKRKKISWTTFGAVSLIVSITAIAFFAALEAPHLPQEYDALNYHLTLPSQHLLRNSFAHIDWSSADLFPLPLDFALAPFWFVRSYPNKFSQFLFLVGLTMILTRLVTRWSPDKPFTIGLVLCALFGSHGFNIQMGTAMMDLIICYLFFAFLDSFLSGHSVLAAVEFSFFVWSKSFTPPQAFVVVGAVGFLFFVLRQMGIRKAGWSFRDYISAKQVAEYKRIAKRFTWLALLSSTLVGGPFVAKSLYYAGTPLYPFAPGLFRTNLEVRKDAMHWESLKEAAKVHQQSRDHYGRGRGLRAFFEHFWFVAVPETDVNNSYDYPLGLPFLLFLGPFFWFLFRTLKQGKFPILPMVVVAYWLSWWFGSQQSRFLYIPLALLFLTVASSWNYSVGVLKGCLLLALVFSLVSIYRAHRYALFSPLTKYVREKDKALMQMNEQFMKSKGVRDIELDYHDVAYARFPVSVASGPLPYVVVRRNI